jgi:hypothetical protein
VPSFSVDTEDEGNKLIRNAGNYLLSYCESYPKICKQNGVDGIYDTSDEKLRWPLEQE